jgi:hypothetical protein
VIACFRRINIENFINFKNIEKWLILLLTIV